MITVLVPCFNEAAGLPRLEDELFDALDGIGKPYEVIAVNDGSTDATAAALEALSQRRRRLRIIAHGVNRGLGAALRTGLEAAKGDWLVLLDADLTFHPRHIAALLEAQTASDADCVSGSPFLSPDTKIPALRRLPSMLLNAFYRGLLDRALTSFTPMFRLYRAEAVRRLRLKSDGFEISVEILAGLLRSGCRVREIAVPLTVRETGESKLRRWRELGNHIALALRLLLL